MLKSLYKKLVQNIEKCNKILNKRGYYYKIKLDDEDSNSAVFQVSDSGIFTLYILDRDDGAEFDGDTLEESFKKAIDYFDPLDYENQLIKEEEEQENYEEEIYQSWANRG